MGKQKYEYYVVTMKDSPDGSISQKLLNDNITIYAKLGYRFVGMYSNELGKNSSTQGIGGYSTSTNATIEEHFLVFEREIIEEAEAYTSFPDIVKISSGLSYEIEGIEFLYPEKEAKIYINDCLDKNIAGIKCKLELNTIFDEVYVFEDIYFTDFKVRAENAKTAVTKISADEKLLSMTKNINIIVERYVETDAVVVCDNETENYTTAEAEWEEKKKVMGIQRALMAKIEQESRKKEEEEKRALLSWDDIIKECEKFDSASQAYEYLLTVSDKVPEEMINEVSKRVSIERMYGKDRRGFMNIINKYLAKTEE